VGKHNITQARTLNALKSKPAGDYMDKSIPGFGVRVSPEGRRTFILIGRYGGSKNPTRRALGVYDAMTVKAARAKARDWIEKLKRGDDPARVEEQERLEALRKRANSFAAVVEDFICEKLPSERKAKEVERDIRRQLIPSLGKIPITDITRQDIRQLIETKKKTAKVRARNLLGLVKRIFNWAVDSEKYGIEVSPADGLKAEKIIGEKVRRTRILKDVELTALWRAAERMLYPYNLIYRLLILSGLRLNEAADASKPEFDILQGLWTIPAERMKGKNHKALPHVVPLTIYSQS